MGIRAKRNLGATRYIAQDNNNDRFINFWFANYTRKNKRESLAELDRYFDKFKPNSLDVWVCWYWVERVRGKYDFSAYDKLIDKIASYGAKVFLRINAMDMPAWLYKVKDEKGRCIYTQWNYYGEDIVGTSYTGGKRAGIISYANPTSRKFVLDFTYAVVSHFKERYADHPQGNPIRMYGSCFSHSGEMEYDYEEKCGDYSPAAIKSFRKWLYNRYADISLLNERWRTAYSSFDEVEAPEITNNTQTVKEMDWLQYRAYEQGNMARLQREAIKKADPNAEYVLVFGSVFDPMIKRRGSLFADYWTEYTDWYGVADCFAYNHRYSMSFVRGISKGRKFYNEAFKEVKDNEKLRFEWLKMTRESFEEGANQMNYAGFPFEDVGKDEYDYYLVAADFIRDKSKVTRPAPKRAIYVSTWSAARDTASVCAEAERVFDELRKDGFIDVIRDGTFESDPEYLIRKYTDIYFISSAYVSDSARRALLYAWGKGVKLHNVTIMLDKYGNQRLPFNKTDTDATPPTVKAALGDGFIAGIADDVGSGINRIEVTIGGKVLIAQGTDTWSVETKDKKGVASIVAVDNNGNRSEEVRIEIK